MTPDLNSREMNYCIAIRFKDGGPLFRTWTARKTDAISYAERLAKGNENDIWALAISSAQDEIVFELFPDDGTKLFV